MAGSGRTFEVKTSTRFGGIDAPADRTVVVMRINVLPRGSGNRPFCRRLAQAFREHESVGQHLVRVVSGSSSVVVEMRPSVQLMVLIASMSLERYAKQIDDAMLANQPMLPGLVAG